MIFCFDVSNFTFQSDCTVYRSTIIPRVQVIRMREILGEPFASTSSNCRDGNEIPPQRLCSEPKQRVDTWSHRGLSVSEKRILWQRFIGSTGFIASDEILEMLPPPSCFGRVASSRCFRLDRMRNEARSRVRVELNDVRQSVDLGLGAAQDE